MKKYKVFLQCLFVVFIINSGMIKANNDSIPPRHKVTLREAHVGDLVTDTRLLDSYLQLSENIREFYLNARTVFEETPDADFTDNKIIKAAQKSNVILMGGPMLGNLNENGVTVGCAFLAADPLAQVSNCAVKKTISVNPGEPVLSKNKRRTGAWY